MNLYHGLWVWKGKKCRFESWQRQIGVKIMAKTEAIWEPTEYKSVCPHCSATNLSKIPVMHYVCTDCNKEYMATVAHTEED